MCVYKIEEIAERVRPIAERYGVGKIYLFGSYARGEATEESDIDLLVDASEIYTAINDIPALKRFCEEQLSE